MKLVNTTAWSSRDLKAFIYRCARELWGGRKLYKDLTVVAKPRPCSAIVDSSPGGRAWYSKVYHKHGYGYFVKLTIPNLADDLEVLKRDLAYVVVHELMHCQGRRHCGRTGTRKTERKYGYGWGKMDFATALALSPRVASVKPKRNLKEERYEHALKMAASYKTRLKRTQTLLKKWQAKVKYYEKQDLV